MPGQRKRRQRQQDQRRRLAARTAPERGRWEALFRTEDSAELRSWLRRLYAEHPGLDAGLVRIDTYCGRLVHPTVSQVSVFVPDGEDPPRLDQTERSRP